MPEEMELDHMVSDGEPDEVELAVADEPRRWLPSKFPF